MLTFDALLADPHLLDSFRWEQTLDLRCSGCGKIAHPKKYHVLRAIKAGRSTYFCSRSCTNHGRHEAAIEIREGMPGRVCITCNDWKPLPEMDAKGRARICMKCKREKPEQIFWAARSRAKWKGWAFTITREAFDALMSEPCFYCGEPPSGLDRQDTSKGYIPKNVVPCCQPCNFGKSDLSVEAFLAHCRKVAAFSRC